MIENINAKAILLNGPKLCGKDKALSYIKGFYPNILTRETKDKLHELTMAFFNLSSEEYYKIYEDRELKEVPLPQFTVTGDEVLKLANIISMDAREHNKGMWQLSIREAMIWVSEVVCKPAFGKDYFGKARALAINSGDIITDGSTAFVEELHPLIDRVGQDNILLIRIHRPGFEFDASDSRGYIPDDIIYNTVDIKNDGTEMLYLNRMLDEVEVFLTIGGICRGVD